MSPEQTQRFYKRLLEEKGVQCITEVRSLCTLCIFVAQPNLKVAQFVDLLSPCADHPIQSPEDGVQTIRSQTTSSGEL